MMKQKNAPNSNRGKCDTLRCPVGCPVCQYAGDHFITEFKSVDLSAGCILPGLAAKMHHILFLTEGTLHVCIDDHAHYYLGAGQCIFLSRNGSRSVTAISDARIFLLNFSNRLMFCKHDCLCEVVSKKAKDSFGTPVMNIKPELDAFLKGVNLVLPGLRNPCYHIIKEYEMYLVMTAAYSVTELAHFFSSILRPKDDFEMFVLNSYKQAQSVQEMAEMSNMSVTHFRRKFLDTFHEPIRTWMMKQKAEEIEKAVRNGLTSTNDLMRAFKFENYNSMYHFFKLYLHAAPTEYFEKNGPNSQEID